MSRTYAVDAKRWEHGWELHVEGLGVTQSRSLHSAARMALEYISLIEGISDESTIDVEIRPQIENALSKEVIAARKAVHELAERQREVASLARRSEGPSRVRPIRRGHRSCARRLASAGLPTVERLTNGRTCARPQSRRPQGRGGINSGPLSTGTSQ